MTTPNARVILPAEATEEMDAAARDRGWPTMASAAEMLTVMIAAAPASGKVTEAEFAALTEALERADNEFGYSMNLVRLVDGEATYRLKYNDGSEPLEFSCTEDVYAHVAKERASTRARAAIASLGLEVEG